MTVVDDRMPPRPQPYVNDVSAGFWEAAQERKLAIQQCRECGTFMHYPLGVCSSCQSEDLGFTEVSGRGTVYSYAIVRHSFHPAFTPPYVIALIDLDDVPGVRMYTNILGVEPEAVSIGMPVQATFEDIGDGMLIPQFTPVERS
jgi:uncharacterized OB-fold protein